MREALSGELCGSYVLFVCSVTKEDCYLCYMEVNIVLKHLLRDNKTGQKEYGYFSSQISSKCCTGQPHFITVLQL